MRLVTAAQMREIDRLTIEKYGTPGFTLMQRAAAGALSVLEECWGSVTGKRILVVAGRGNNGGDGMVLASLLLGRGAEVRVVLLATREQLRGDALRAFEMLEQSRVPVVLDGGEDTVRAQATESDYVVDAIFGTGLNSPVSGKYAGVIAALNESGRPIFALDIPSGLDADRGIPLGIAVRAALTATFGFAKRGQVLYPGVEYVGTLRVVDIGLAPEAVRSVNPQCFFTEPGDLVGLLPRRAPDTHKGHFGHVLVLGGARGRTGAAILAAEASVRAGAGLTTVAAPASVASVVTCYRPEVMTVGLPERDGHFLFDEGALRAALAGKSVVVLGPGMGTDEEALAITGFVLAESGLPVVCDADALTCLARAPELLQRCTSTPILTPHPGEMARLLGCSARDVQNDRPGLAERFARTHGCVLVLKGARTVIAAPSGEMWVNPSGNPGMASGGMGDVLAGVTGALRAQGLAPLDAARLATFVHGAAADRLSAEFAPFGFLASEVARLVPAILSELLP